jgi:lipid II:glycine glycyltransferase (peptidoglycan interpeptide bridge formation enzyme)
MEDGDLPDRRSLACKHFAFHKIDLTKDLTVIHGRFHESCIRRKIKRAEKEKLTYEAGGSEELLNKFWQLFVLTRRRHMLPPQPMGWFRNLAHLLGNNLTIHTVSKDQIPVASIITLMYKRTLVYKYGCSDARYHNLGGTALLFWKAVAMGKQIGAEELDLGRSGFDDTGLIAFKEHLGGIPSELTYYRINSSAKAYGADVPIRWAGTITAKLPRWLLTGVGELIYKHIG